MDLNKDFENLIHCLNREGADFLVVGAYAVMIHTQPRYTKDIDFLVRATKKNAEKVYQALQKFGAPLQDLTLEDLSNPELVYQIGVEPNRIDILMGIDGLGFEEAWKNKESFHYGAEPIFVMSVADLIRTKKAVGRPKDLLDVESLKKNRRSSP